VSEETEYSLNVERHMIFEITSRQALGASQLLNGYQGKFLRGKVARACNS
jgi:hypothetical protein